MGEAINNQTSDLNRMVNDIRWTQGWLQEREAKLTKLERLVRYNRASQHGEESGEEMPQKLSMLETEMDTDLTFFELSASGLSDVSDDDMMYVEHANDRKLSSRPLQTMNIPPQNFLPVHRAPTPRTYTREAWRLPPSQTTPVRSSVRRGTTEADTAQKENTHMPVSSAGTSSIGTSPGMPQETAPPAASTIAHTSTSTDGKRPMSTSANAGAAAARSEIQKFAQRCLHTNEAYEDHMQWLAKLRAEIGRSVYRLHDKGTLAHAEVRATTGQRVTIPGMEALDM